MSRPRNSSPPTVEAGYPPAIGRFIARHRGNRLIRKFARICRQYLDWYGNLSYDPQNNGEAFVLRTLSQFRPRVLFDVGANVGEWTTLAKSLCPTAEVHAFEIAPPTFETLVANTRGLPNVRCVNLGLSDAPGLIRIRHFNSMPALTTTTEYPHPFAFTELDATVTTGDAYAATAGISHIDLLKIDVEGMEERVLKGFRGMLERRAIDLVQFEYGRVSILNHFLLRDFHELFRSHGYVVGKIFPDAVDFREYSLEDEDFLGPNYIACLEERADYREALCGARGARASAGSLPQRRAPSCK